MTEDEKEGIKRGDMIAEVLKLKRDRNTGRFNTTWGDKTSLGLFNTVKRLVEEPLVFGK